MRVLVLGAAGLEGSQLATILAGRAFTSQVLLGDINLNRCQEVGGRIGGKAAAFHVDINDHDRLVQLIREADVVCNMVGPYWDSEPKVVRAAIEAQRHYVDICDDYVCIDVRRDYHEAALGAGITAICGFGASPGLTNVWARHGAERLDQVERIRIFLLAGFGIFGRTVWSHIFEYYTAFDGKIPVCRNGEILYMDPGVEPEEVEFPSPTGRREVQILPHAEPLMFHQDRALLKGVKEVVVKGGFGQAGKEFSGFCLDLMRMGLTSKEPIPTLTPPLSPREFLAEYLSSELFRQSQTFREMEERGRGPNTGLELVVEVEGKHEGQTARYACSLIHADRGLSIVEPPALAVELLAEGKIPEKGVLFPHQIDPELLVSRLRGRIDWEEKAA